MRFPTCIGIAVLLGGCGSIEEVENTPTETAAMETLPDECHEGSTLALAWSDVNTAALYSSLDDAEIICEADGDRRTFIDMDTEQQSYSFSGLLASTTYVCSDQCTTTLTFQTEPLPQKLQSAFIPIDPNRLDLPWMFGQYSYIDAQANWHFYYLVADPQGRIRYYFDSPNAGSVEVVHMGTGAEFLVATATDETPDEECFLYYSGLPIPCTEGIPGRMNMLQEQTTPILETDYVCEHDRGFGEPHSVKQLPNGDILTFKTGIAVNKADQDVYYAILITQFDAAGNVVGYWCSEEHAEQHGASQGLPVVENPQPPASGQLSWLDPGADPYHANALCVNCEEGHLWVSLRSLHAVLSLDVRGGLTGAPISWVLGGLTNQFELFDEDGHPTDDIFRNQHDVRADGLGQFTVFNNGWNEALDGIDGHSEALLFDVDVEARVASTVKSWYLSEDWSQPIFGSVDTNSDGLHLVDMYFGYPVSSGQLYSAWVILDSGFVDVEGGVVLSSPVAQSYQARMIDPADFGTLE